MVCWDISAGGEMVCPSSDAPEWITRPFTELPATGLSLTLWGLVALILIIVGLLIVDAGHQR